MRLFARAVIATAALALVGGVGLAATSTSASAQDVRIRVGTPTPYYHSQRPVLSLAATRLQIPADHSVLLSDPAPLLPIAEAQRHEMPLGAQSRARLLVTDRIWNGSLLAQAAVSVRASPTWF